jgi:hypothetical protein
MLGMRRIHLAPHLTTDELEQRYRQAGEPHERSGWQILWLLSRGQTAKAVADRTGYSAYWIGQLAKRYTVDGPDALRHRQHTRPRLPPTLLSRAQLEELRAALAGRRSPGGPPRASAGVGGWWGSGSPRASAARCATRRAGPTCSASKHGSASRVRGRSRQVAAGGGRWRPARRHRRP